MVNKAAEITILRFPDNVRLRKEMYLNDPNHCLFEIIDNAVDEASSGYCDFIGIAIIGDRVVVEDNGRGIPVTPHKDPEYKGLSQAEVAYTVLHAGAKFGQRDGYRTATGGLHGVGASCVNAVSEETVLTIKTNGKKYQALFSKGHIIQNLKNVENIEKTDTGTKVEFVLDKEIWKNETFDFKKIEKRIKQLAYLNPGLSFALYVDSIDKENNNVHIENNYFYENGIKDYIEYLLKTKKSISEIFHIVKNVEHESLGKIELSTAFVYTDGFNQDIYTYVNNIATEDGGDHLIGFKQAVHKAISQYMLDTNEIKDIKTVESDDTREGLIAIVSIKVFEPKFEGQGKNRIKMPEVKNIVKQIIEEYFYDTLNQDQLKAKEIVNKVINAMKARLAAKKAREAIRSQKESFESGLAAKLADCTEKNPEKCEIFIVEGDSAAGSCKKARDRKTQAILPVFGKILNVEKKNFLQVVNSTKLMDMLKAFKCGISEDLDLNKLRYHKIILLADADTDGKHITCLNLCFFYRYLKPIIENGHLYIACPPLFKISKKIGKKEETIYLYSKEELEAFNTEGYSVQRYKGLGEMNPDQLWETTMNPETRILKQITVEDFENAEKYLSLCMGEEVFLRKKFILYGEID